METTSAETIQVMESEVNTVSHAETEGDVTATTVSPETPVTNDEISNENINEVWDEFEEKKNETEKIVEEEIGSVEKAYNSPALKKAAYYAVFAQEEHPATEVGTAIKSVHIARFESKAQLKKVVTTLHTGGFKLIDILRGRPIGFEIKTRKVSEITIG